MSALVANGYNAAPHHRQNRRRERPGSRSRRAVTRKSLLQESFLIQEASEEAYDSRNASVSKPLVKATPSPLLRQSFDQSWEKWKAREAQQKAQAELKKTAQDDMTLLELEQRRLFGGDVGDDVSLCESMLQELYALGILYEDAEDAEGFLIVEEPPPAFVIRPGRPRRPRRSARQKLPRDSSFYIIDSDIAVAPGMPVAAPHHSPILHRSSNNSLDNDTPQQSLPLSTTVSATPSYSEILDSLSSPAAGDWTLVHAADTEQQQQHVLASSTSPSEPETWILLGDDS